MPQKGKEAQFSCCKQRFGQFPFLICLHGGQKTAFSLFNSGFKLPFFAKTLGVNRLSKGQGFQKDDTFTINSGNLSIKCFMF